MTEMRTAPDADASTLEFWEATRERRLVIQRCVACGHFQHYPRPFCLSCRGDDLEFAAVSGDATIHSFTVVHRSPTPELEAPYVVALVQLAQGPVLLSNIVDAVIEEIACGMAVTVAWEPLADGRNLAVFKPGGRTDGL